MTHYGAFAQNIVPELGEPPAGLDFSSLFYLDLFRCLHRRDVRYLLAGGFEAAMSQALVQEVETVPICIASLDDMITLKQNTGRRQDQDDVEHLLRIKGSNRE